jgi:hypothetical protein
VLRYAQSLPFFYISFSRMKTNLKETMRRLRNSQKKSNRSLKIWLPPSSVRIDHFKSISNILICCFASGRGGCKVKELEQLSGARIHMSDSSDDKNIKLCIIQGNPTAVELADGLIEEIVEQMKSIETSSVTVPHWTLGKIIGMSLQCGIQTGISHFLIRRKGRS